MKKMLFLMVLVLLTGALIMCSGEQKQEAKQEAQEDVQATAVSDTALAVCPGCGMEMAEAEMVSQEVDGKTEYFCSEECKENYMASKEKTDSPPPAKTN